MNTEEDNRLIVLTRDEIVSAKVPWFGDNTSPTRAPAPIVIQSEPEGLPGRYRVVVLSGNPSAGNKASMVLVLDLSDDTWHAVTDDGRLTSLDAIGRGEYASARTVARWGTNESNVTMVAARNVLDVPLSGPRAIARLADIKLWAVLSGDLKVAIERGYVPDADILSDTQSAMAVIFPDTPRGEMEAAAEASLATWKKDPESFATMMQPADADAE